MGLQFHDEQLLNAYALDGYEPQIAKGFVDMQAAPEAR